MFVHHCFNTLNELRFIDLEMQVSLYKLTQFTMGSESVILFFILWGGGGGGLPALAFG